MRAEGQRVDMGGGPGSALQAVAPRTWLLATVAGWAVLAWLLALGGLGGRLAPLDEDASLRQPLPQPRPSSPERLGPFAQYGGIATRPLFSDDRRPKPFSLRGQGDEEQADTFDYVLTSVLLTPRLKMAILQPAAEAGNQAGEGGPRSVLFKLGESAEQAAGWRLVSLQPRQAVFEGPEGQRTLQLRAFDGSGGAPATPPTDPRTAANAGRNAAREAARAASQAADVAAQAADDAATPEGAANRGARRAVNPAPVPAPPSEPAANTPDAQIEAIRKRIQARREQLRREAQQTPAPDR